MKVMRSVLGLLVVLLATLPGLAGCERCSRFTPLAELVQKTGRVERDQAKAEGQWAPAEVGSEYEVGDAVRTGAKATAELDLDDGSRLALEEQTIVRFLEREPGGNSQALGVELGEASLEAPQRGTVLETAFGAARLEGGTKVQLKRSDDNIRYRVLVGRATLEDDEGTTRTLEAGDSFEIAIGQAVLEPPENSSQEAPESDEANGITATVRGPGVTWRPPGEVEPSAADPGSLQVPAGATFQVPAGSSVTVVQGGHRATLSGSGTYVVGQQGQFVSSSGGSFAVASQDVVRVSVPGGTIVTRPGGGARLTDKGTAGTEVLTTQGTVVVEGNSSEAVAVGQKAVLGRDGEVSVEGKGVAYADVVITAGESVVIHDPSPPTAVRFAFAGKCQGGAIQLDARGPSASGAEAVALEIAAGSTDYRLRCLEGGEALDEVVAEGRVTVLADAGTRAVPKTAPATYVNVDGRSYTVLYQHQLPQVSLTWGTAPEGAGGFKLHVSGASGSRTYDTSGPSYVFGSGRLGPGTHYFYFEGGGRVSRKSAVTIRFDNATPTASLKTPVATGVAPGASVELRGSALPGWSVSVDGKEVATDAAGGFSVPATMPSDKRAVAVRLTHPKRGTHIYIRRAQGAP